MIIRNTKLGRGGGAVNILIHEAEPKTEVSPLITTCTAICDKYKLYHITIPFFQPILPGGSQAFRSHLRQTFSVLIEATYSPRP